MLTTSHAQGLVGHLWRTGTCATADGRHRSHSTAGADAPPRALLKEATLRRACPLALARPSATRREVLLQHVWFPHLLLHRMYIHLCTC